MNKNVGLLDARIRIAAGMVLGSLGMASVLGVLELSVLTALGMMLVAVVLVVEGLTRRCVLYRLLGIDRCPVDT